MISSDQDNQITDYLILHRLPLDILLEVKDHMAAQITDIQASEGLGFEEAFLETQRQWADEFKMVNYSVFYSGQIPAIVKKIAKARNKRMLAEALVLGLISFAVQYLLIFLSADEEACSDLFRIYVTLLIISPFMMWILNPDLRKYIKGTFRYRGKVLYSIYQQNLGMYIGTVSLFFQLVNRDFHYAFRFFRTNEPSGALPVIIEFTFPYILHVLIVFILINFFGHKKAVSQLKGFLVLP